jgi:imidazolonepropionase-like amidohydrolase
VSRSLAAIVVCLVALVAAAGSAPQTDVPLVMSDVTLIDGTGAPPRAGMTIVVRGGLIADIYPTGSRPSPPAARDLGVAGRFVTPGFIDTHVHLATTERPPALVSALMRATLLGGVTTVRDMGGNGVVVAALQQTAQAPGALSPDIRAAAVFAGPDTFWFTDKARVGYLNDGRAPGSGPWLVRVDDRTDIRAAVTRAKAWGASGIKIYEQLTARHVRSIADEARRQQLPVWSHAHVGPATVRDVVDARATTMSHADYLVWAGRTGVVPPLVGRPAGMAQAINVVPAASRAIADLLDHMKGRGVMLEPTLYIGVQAASFAGDDRTPIDRRVAWAAEVTAIAQKMGVTIVAGTDALGGSSPNLHAELQLLVSRAGLTPLQAIRAATFDAARALGAAGAVGSIATGRRADLVILERNPADDIRNTLTVSIVLRNGIVHRRTEPMPVPPLAQAPVR